MIQISSTKQYEAVANLLTLLNRLNIPGMLPVLLNFMEDEEDEWTLCDGCATYRSECACAYEEDSIHSVYDDEGMYG